MDTRPNLFQSPVMLCSIYLDPRVMFKLSNEQRATSAMELLKIYDRITSSLHSATDQNERQNDTLDEIQEDYHVPLDENRNNRDKILGILAIYEQERPYDIRAPVMKFWEEKNDKYMLIRPLAELLHAVPSNQCYTERAFSSLSYIRSKYRMRMSSKNLSNVLMIRLNKDIFYSMRKENIENILNPPKKKKDF